MNDLIKKYRINELSPEDLSVLRGNANAMDNQDLENLILDDWLHEEINTSSVDDKLLQKIKGKIDQEVKPESNRFSLILRWTQLAAAVLLPVFCHTKFLLVS